MISRTLLLSVGVVTLSACGDDAIAPIAHHAATVSVTPDSISLRIGHTVHMDATVKDSSGGEIAHPIITWKTSDAALATVDTSGLVTALAAGSVVVTATVDSVTGSATLIVLTPVAFVSLTPSTAILVPGGTLEFSAAALGPALQPLSDRFVSWLTGNPTIAAVSTEGQVTGLATGSTTVSATSEGVSSPFLPITVRQPTFTTLASGPESNETCGIESDGSTFCWGRDADGELGIGLAVEQGLLGKPRPAGIPSHKFFSLSLGGYFACGVERSPAVDLGDCWGGGVDGTLANGGVTGSLSPVAVKDLIQFFHIIASGLNHVCAIGPNGVAYCWGRPPGLGTAGPNTVPRAFTPVPVDGGLKFTTIGAGFHVTCGLASDSLAYCWGFIIGSDTATDIYSGVHVVNGSHKYVALAVGEGHACGIATDSMTYCWGRNRSGQLGNGTTDTATTPVVVSGGHKFVALTAGFASTCGLTSTGTAFCWGHNGYGQLGAGTAATCSGDPCSTTPIPVSGGLTFQSVVGGAGHTCGLTVTSIAYCWGANDFGQIGDGTSINRPAPTRVAGQP